MTLAALPSRALLEAFSGGEKCRRAGERGAQTEWQPPPQSVHVPPIRRRAGSRSARCTEAEMDTLKYKVVA